MGKQYITLIIRGAEADGSVHHLLMAPMKSEEKCEKTKMYISRKWKTKLKE